MYAKPIFLAPVLLSEFTGYSLNSPGRRSRNLLKAPTSTRR